MEKGDNKNRTMVNYSEFCDAFVFLAVKDKSLNRKGREEFTQRTQKKTVKI